MRCWGSLTLTPTYAGFISAAIASNRTPKGFMNYFMRGGEEGWRAAQLGLVKAGFKVSVTTLKDGGNLQILTGALRDGTSIEVRNFSAGGGKSYLTIQITQAGSLIKQKFRWELH
ncbi:hypothetical protein FNZ56_10080 [Pseudoluteimonas lycopersici]|uniref:Uncharacterized protein n=1 Tax=Pseudoluteimonas lycopersici TaxID=1324796 RepID=A0A516V6R1_9GAMM|nr:hypothetical protein [Lysobacter lycopersici]QDQ74202.1 hypothetical protein FNZ56_10080 [Lysobacter lycopersici]